MFLQLLPRSSTGERMNPYTSLWTGVTPGDGPQELHVVLLDNGRTRVLARRGRQAGAALHPLQRLPERLPRLLAHGRPRLRLGLPGPIGAILTPQLIGIENAPSLPFASSLCGACYEVCPVKIDIPTVLLHLRGKAVAPSTPDAERLLMRSVAWVFGGRRRFTLAQRLARLTQRPFARGGRIRRLPGPLAAWTKSAT